MTLLESAASGNQCLDGISIMIVSSSVPPIYYAVICNPSSRLAYLSIISSLGMLVILTLLAPALSSPRFRPFRAALFLIMGFSRVVPAVHAGVINGEHQQCHLPLGLEVAVGLAYATGADFYVTRVLERWKTCAFDIAGHSHQIFHVFVLVGALTHYAASNLLLDSRDGGAGCTAPSATLALQRCLSWSVDLDFEVDKSEMVQKFCFFICCYRGCLDSKNWCEVRKWGSIIAHFPIYPNTGKGK